MLDWDLKAPYSEDGVSGLRVVGVLLSALFVSVRVAQRLMKNGLGLDDYTILASLVTSALLTLTECQAVKYGYGRKYASIPRDKAFTARQWFYGAQIVYKVVPTLNKISITCLYYRIFAVSAKSFRTACHITLAFFIATGLAFTIGTVFQCQPIAAFWDKTITGAKCFENEPWWISFAVIQILSDVWLMALPMRQVMKLSMTKTEKIGLCCVFSTGFFVTFASIYRATTLAASANDPDPTWGPIPATVWSVIECNAGIVCACLPMLRQPFIHVFGPLFGSRDRSGQRSYQLTSRSNPQRSGIVTSQKDGLGTMADLERESEERIMGFRAENDRVFDGSRNADNSAIVIKNEFSVTRSETTETMGSKKSEDRRRDVAKEHNANDDKRGWQSTFSPV